ncbi:DUF4296 domain-containing protein [Aurantibacillus circumpalustris]|uniref:DUF4296 domain-containing protein n=1 Tax=Aurantibacillus circumpalustris TaxID=3036359 RepID=UPI00295A5785|nr:DUF4296 domain-containing protein [Aurantibacillus circumpalustris]
MFKALYLFLTLSLLFFAACVSTANKEDKVPAEILNRDTLIKILAEFALAESAANLNVTNINFNKMDSAYAFNPIKDNHVRQSQYDSAITYYVGHPELYKEIYENVLVTLSELQAKRAPAATDTSAK